MKKYKTGKWKYGSVSTLMLAMILAALIALNAGVYALEKKNGWRRFVSRFLFLLDRNCSQHCFQVVPDFLD